MTSSSRVKRRVVIVDDSRTMQAFLESRFGERGDFNVVAVAGDAQSGAKMIEILKPDIATIDLVMPYIDGAALLRTLDKRSDTCMITVSDQSAKNILVAAELKKLGASACLSKHELAEDPKAFFDKVNAAYEAFRVERKRRLAAIEAESKTALPTHVESRPAVAHFGFPVPLDEDHRLDFLGRTQLANAEPERMFDLLTKHLAALTGYPVCLLTFIDRHTQWIKSGTGLDAGSTPRAQAFCNYTISQGGAFVVANAAADSRFASNPFVAGAPHIRSYAGYPVLADDGTRVGSLCLIDVKPRVISKGALAALSSMAEIMSETIRQRPAAGYQPQACD